jgi:hypothetical protein
MEVGLHDAVITNEKQFGVHTAIGHGYIDYPALGQR